MAGRLPAAWMDDFYARVDIVQVVSAYVPLKRDGSRFWGLCPFHHEKTPSFSVNAEQNLYYCFGCKAGGNVVQFVMEMERLTYVEAVRHLAGLMRLPVPDEVIDPGYQQRKSQRERLLAANKEAAQWYHQRLWTDKGQPFLAYFHRRGLTDSTIRKFGLGASPGDWDGLTAHLLSNGYSLEELRLAGLTVVKDDTRYDMFRNRAVFPIIDAQGNVLGFGGRAMGDAQPKYLNTADTPVFNKRRGVYAVNLLKKQRNLKRVVLVEGYMDVVSLVQSGVAGVVATLGTSLTSEQARLLKRFAPEVWVAYDGDDAGQNAIMRALDIFEQEGIPARVLVFPDDLDPDDFIRTRGIDAFNALRPLRAPEHRMQRAKEGLDLSDADGRMEYARRCAVFLRREAEPVVLDTCLQSLSLQTGFSREVLLRQMGISAPKVHKITNFREKISPKRDGAGLRDEMTLLNLIASGFLPEGAVLQEDFDTPCLKDAAERLLGGASPAALLADCEDESTRQRLSQALALDADIKRENAFAIAQDCRRAIRIRRLEKQIADISASLGTASTEEKAASMQQLKVLSAELARIKRAGR